ncbi:MAG: 16S rRNA (cytidine(1402)-2'-O)-methyltransferase [Pseudomonadota bacterium]
MDKAPLLPALYVVATPIGNLGDITQRALDVLKRADCIAAEDTRVTGRLLAALGIRKPLLSVREHNERQGAEKLIAKIAAGEAVAYVSDAGTPAISDPGALLVAAVREAGLAVVPVPGPSAVVAAMSVAGFAPGPWLFAGFLPPRQKARRDAIRAWKHLPAVLVFFEAPHRVRETLADLAAVLGGDRRICIARELTKQFEETACMRLDETTAWLDAGAYREKGEFVLMVEGAAAADTDMAGAEHILRVLAEELPAAQAAKIAAKLTGRKKAELYALLVQGQE